MVVIALSVCTLLVIVAALVVWSSFRLGQKSEQRELETEWQELEAGWTALEQARRVNNVFFHARDAMRRAEQGTRKQS